VFPLRKLRNEQAGRGIAVILLGLVSSKGALQRTFGR